MQSRIGRVTPWIVLLLVVGLGALAVYWGNYGQSDTLAPTVEVKASNAALASTTPPAEASEQATKTVAALQETIKDLQSTQKQLQDRVERVEMQLTKEQGEAKMLSDQVGALSGRVNGLSATGSISQIPKKKL